MPIIATHNDIDIVYSPDDGGYYAHATGTDKVSPVYNELAELIQAVRVGTISWGN